MTTSARENRRAREPKSCGELEKRVLESRLFQCVHVLANKGTWVPCSMKCVRLRVGSVRLRRVVRCMTMRNACRPYYARRLAIQDIRFRVRTSSVGVGSLPAPRTSPMGCRRTVTQPHTPRQTPPHSTQPAWRAASNRDERIHTVVTLSGSMELRTLSSMDKILIVSVTAG